MRKCRKPNRTGGADGIRTHYLLNANQALSQLSYSPEVTEIIQAMLALFQ